MTHRNVVIAGHQNSPVGGGPNPPSPCVLRGGLEERPRVQENEKAEKCRFPRERNVDFMHTCE